MTRLALASFHQFILNIGKCRCDNRQITKFCKKLKIAICTVHVHFSNVMFHIILVTSYSPLLISW